MTKKRAPYEGPCAVGGVLEVFGGKWKPGILYHLTTEGTLRFSELHKRMPEVSKRVLTLHLRELQRDGLVAREEFDEQPPRVEYSPTAVGTSLAVVFKALEAWGQENMDAVKAARERFGDL